MKKVTQSKQKVINCLDNFIDSDYFQSAIKKLRKELKIPLKGFKLSDDLQTRFVENLAIYNGIQWCALQTPPL